MNKRPLRLLTYGLRLMLICLLVIHRHDNFAQSGSGSSGAVQPRPVNLDFEQGAAGQMPNGWVSPTRINYAVELTEEKPKSGKRAALLRSLPAATAGGSPFGNLMQVFDAAPYRSRRVRFRAAVRMEASEPGTLAQLWMRVDRANNNSGFLDNMDDRPITSGEWQHYEITGDVDEDAVVINIGMILIGKGKAWLDDVSFEDLGKPVVLSEPARPLTGQGLQNLTAFTRLLGYVRHFHPGDEAADADWDAFAVAGVRAIEDAKNAAETAQRLEAIFHPVAPSVRVFPTGERPQLPHEIQFPGADSAIKIMTWRHNGFGYKALQPAIYYSKRVSQDAPGGKIPENAPDPQKPFTADLGGGVSCLVPLALFADVKGTLPHVAPRPTDSRAALVRYSGNDRATRLADVALAWNIFQHFYPYFDVIQTDWQQVLSHSLTSAANDPNERAFLNTLRRMVAQLRDGHGGVYHPSDTANYTVPVIFGWVEGRLIITHVAAEGTNGLQPGDIILEVDGQPAVEALAKREELISGATPQWRRHIAIAALGAGAKDTELRLAAQTISGQTRSVVLRRSVEAYAQAEPRPPKVDEIKPGIFYLDLDRMEDADFQAALPRLEKAKGIIFDVRGYPKTSDVVISHLIDKPVQSAQWMVPIITTPDRKGAIEYNTSGRWNLQPIAPRLTAKTAFLTDGRAISYAESYMGIIEAYKLAEIVGEPTAGTNGNNNSFRLPGDYTVFWTGMKVLKHDGSQHHGVGIKPTVPASRTIRGVAEKRDEQLERAIAIVSQ